MLGGEAGLFFLCGSLGRSSFRFQALGRFRRQTLVFFRLRGIELGLPLSGLCCGNGVQFSLDLSEPCHGSGIARQELQGLLVLKFGVIPALPCHCTLRVFDGILVTHLVPALVVRGIGQTVQFFVNLASHFCGVPQIEFDFLAVDVEHSNPDGRLQDGLVEPIHLVKQRHVQLKTKPVKPHVLRNDCPVHLHTLGNGSLRLKHEHVVAS